MFTTVYIASLLVLSYMIYRKVKRLANIGRHDYFTLGVLVGFALFPVINTIVLMSFAAFYAKDNKVRLQELWKKWTTPNNQ
jgi:hypothetical protein